MSGDDKPTDKPMDKSVPTIVRGGWVSPVCLYIAGPMSGLPDFNYPAFNEAEGQLRAASFEVENPARNPEPSPEHDDDQWRGYMRMALRQLALCDGVALLPGWKASRGANIEKRLAEDLGLPAKPLSEWLRP